MSTALVMRSPGGRVPTTRSTNRLRFPLEVARCLSAQMILVFSNTLGRGMEARRLPERGGGQALLDRKTRWSSDAWIGRSDEPRNRY
jgi:hypothetical protein